MCANDIRLVRNETPVTSWKVAQKSILRFEHSRFSFEFSIVLARVLVESGSLSSSSTEPKSFNPVFVYVRIVESRVEFFIEGVIVFFCDREMFSRCSLC